ncbi:1-acyl-sn-glycerol-3-phosphate acyltransferase [Paracoccus sp. Z118]|uniref:lysophospholipid acyltransferase family protein n=1 Tax=Paracoccus sp. Z118 TaxID=2851017 RepID=UPI001C2CA877|nr:lysophospholipid acyltransferase family protein [Paracoccus sp. Z118]MBV0892039.1 1-acyl-sn-glycerol-3-phosphate acyltransferase [Paracoccus sp. Z118]
MTRPGYQPGPLPALWWLRAASYYVHVGLATLVIGLWGLPKAMRQGRTGALRVSEVWIGYMLRAARWHYGVRVEVRGTPPVSDCIVAAKHQSFLDILAIAQACPQRAFIMKKEIMRVPIMGWFAREVGSVPIDRARGPAARAAMVAAVQKAMRRGLGQLIIYPEGTRTKPGERRPWKAGVVTLYAASGLPCQPVATNAGMFWPRDGLRVRPGVAVIEFLDPIPPGQPPAELLPNVEPLVEDASDRLMGDAGLSLPPR